MTSYASGFKKPRVLIVLAVLAAVVLAVVLAVRAVRAPDAATPGIVPGYLANAVPGQVEDADRHGTVKLPSGDLVLSVAKPTQKVDSVWLPPPGGEESTDESNAGENRIVHIGWQLGSGTSSVGVDTGTYQFHVTLVSDGHRYALPASSWSDDDPDFPYTSVVDEAAWYVVVAGKAKHLQVEVEYDGQVQTLDLSSGKVDRGRAAYLYTKTAPETDYPCNLLDRRQRARFRDDTKCELEVVPPVPYFPGLGWTDSADQGWSVVSVDLEAFDLLSANDNGGYKDFEVRPGDLRLTIDGRAPDRVLFPYEGLGSIVGTYVFRTSMAPRTLSVKAPFSATDDVDDEVVHFGLDRRIRLH